MTLTPPSEQFLGIAVRDALVAVRVQQQIPLDREVDDALNLRAGG